MKRSVRRTLVVLISAVALLAPAVAASAATDSKATVLSRWTQTTASSTAAWNAARLDRAPWAGYGFDWSTDYCSSSPDNPLGFNFTLSCWRHDFGYRNYKASASSRPTRTASTTSSTRTSSASAPPTARWSGRPATAWPGRTPGGAHFGSLAAVKPSDIDRARPHDRMRPHASGPISGGRSGPTRAPGPGARRPAPVATIRSKPSSAPSA